MLSMIWDIIYVSGGIFLELARYFIILLDILFCIIIVFWERRNPQTALLWIILMLFLPILGFIIYLFLGRHLYGAHIFTRKTIADRAIAAYAGGQMEQLKNAGGESGLYGFEPVAAFLCAADNAFLTENNAVERFTDGEAKFAAFCETVASAEKYIHLEYFIIRDDELGRDIIALLAKKAQEGVIVRAIFDAGGTFSIRKKKFFAPLLEAGGDVRIFFPLKIPFLNTRLHFRDHRKILVVDGKTGMIGGFNIGDEYLGKGHLGYWRDTHLRIKGGGVAGLQSRFIMDWNYAAKDAPIEMNAENASLYYPENLWENYGTSRVQIASSGPDSPEKAIYNGYVDLLSRAKKSVYIHSPYFVPDEPMLNAFRIAIRSGVDVRIVIPCKPDHPFIYWTNHSYLGDLIRLGARGYEYNDGFIHSKASIYDGEVAAVGTANWDVRSFKLNFETQAFVYDKEFASEMSADFLKELETNCKEITLADYNNRPAAMKIKEGICRLFSPIL
ncbi:MAG TPA: cardiolipin synthase [Methanocorpusculum sp.]|nr:cardiolipin synthase [Methanocorpusculum sp.]